ncbi:chloride channel protein [Apibacter sp. HY039]|uniref:chloride channel protein n=1 Tax=Apibacter sp. HY039 TaxID=2501476 RepID=UPI000FEBE23A|nr:chloride channel protein [Apibacter sp. HY039]
MIPTLLKRLRIKYNIAIRKFRYQNPEAFVYLVSTLIGITGGLSAVILKNLVSFTEELVYHNENIHYNYWTIILPAIGILLTVIYIKYFVKANISHGVEKVLYAISKNRSKIDKKNTYSSVISSSLTVGFGGSVGLEAPIVYTGAAIGSNIAQKFNLNLKLRTLFIACGCSAAIAGIFKAPIAAIIFSLEVLMIDLSMWSLIPILISSTTGALVSYFLLGDKISFYFAIFEPFDKTKIPFYVLLGMSCGFFSLYFTKVSRLTEKFFSKYKNKYLKALLGGGAVGILIFVFPPLFGEGYIGLQHLMSDHPESIANNSFFYSLRSHDYFLIIFLIGILFIKVIASSFTTASGGIGGVFAPALFTGGILGFVFAKIINLFNWVKLSEHNFTLVGMAGVMAGIMHAPMTSIFLIAEITGGYNLLFPLIITSSVAYLVKYRLDKYSVYTYNLKRQNQMITHNKDKEAIRRMNMEDLIETDFITVPLTLSLSKFIKEEIPKSRKNLFVVENVEGIFIGVILVDELMDVLLNKEKYENLKIVDVVSKPPAVINLHDDNEAVFKLFDQTNSWYLPVVENKKYIGMLSKSKLLQKYRKLIVDFSED